MLALSLKLTHLGGAPLAFLERIHERLSGFYRAASEIYRNFVDLLDAMSGDTASVM